MEQSANPYRHLSEYASVLSVALGERDGYTRFHSERVVSIATEIGRLCGMGEHDLELLCLASALHDVGKIGIPDHILLKRGSFDETEWGRMKTHAVIGEKILRALPLPGMETVAEAVRHHHEHFDGHGYPDGLLGEDIPALARIISVADSYDALASVRSYHGGRSHADVMAILHGEIGGKHDPYIFARFAGVIDTSPFRAL